MDKVRMVSYIVAIAEKINKSEKIQAPLAS